MRALILFVIFFFYTSSAHAYLDPGTFGLVINFFLALIAGISAYFVLFWNKIKIFFIKKKKK